MRRGRFVVLEGPDGAGKTMQAARLAAALRAGGRVVVETAEPTQSRTGVFVRQILGDPSQPRAGLPWLFAADRAEHLAAVIEPALTSGADVVCSRFVPSSIAYQALGGHDPVQVARLNEGFRPPDLTVLLHVDVETARQRIDARGEKAERAWELEHLGRVGAAYEDAKRLLERKGWHFLVLDGRQHPNALVEALADAVARLEVP